MENTLDLTEILKGCEGMEFHCTPYGDVRLESVDTEIAKHLTVRENRGAFRVLDEFGKMSKDGECVFFPSKTQRDWLKFKKPDPIPQAGEVCWTLSSVGNWVPRVATGELENGKPTFFVNQFDKKEKRAYPWRTWCDFNELQKK